MGKPGKVYVFGTGDCAQLGLGEDIMSRKKPANLAVLNDKEIVDIAAGGMHNMALTKDGKVRECDHCEFDPICKLHI